MVSIQIPKEIYQLLQDRMQSSPFSDISDYITFILQQNLDADTSTPEENAEVEIEERLKNLGYM